MGITIFQSFYVPPLNHILGLKLLGEPNSLNWQTVRLEKNATHRTVEHLIGNIREDTSLWFYDKSYPNSYEPGAHITFSRHHGELLCNFTTHASISCNFPLEQAEAVEYLWACRADNQPGAIRYDYNDDGVMIFDVSAEVPNEIDRDPKNRYRLHMDSRIAAGKLHGLQSQDLQN